MADGKSYLADKYQINETWQMKYIQGKVILQMASYNWPLNIRLKGYDRLKQGKNIWQMASTGQKAHGRWQIIIGW